MIGTVLIRTALLAATAVPAALLLAQPAAAQDASQLQTIEAQIKALQTELQKMKRDLATREQQVRAAQQQATQAKAEAQQAATQASQVQSQVAAQQTQAVQAVSQPALPKGAFRIGGVTVQLGGFIEMDGIYRSRNEVADLSTSWTGIPLGNSAQHYESESRFSARQSRISMLASGKPDDVTTLTAYGEADFQGAAPTANSAQSNSYNVRLRQAFAEYERSDWGLHVLGGQAWSLITLNRSGIDPFKVNAPITIDAQYVPGFNYLRVPQFRVAKDFDDHKFWLAVSAESPQANFASVSNCASGSLTATCGVIGNTSVNYNNAGGSGYASTVSYSNDIAPDFIVKAAADPGFGHYEVYGLLRFIDSRADSVGAGTNHTVVAGGGGAGFIVPVIPNYLDFQGSFLAGDGIGRYGAAQLPDATIGPDGAPKLIPEVEAMIGLVGHPTPAFDVYGYLGTEQESSEAFTETKGKVTTGYGYGSPLYSNAGCNTELSTATCTANTSGVTAGALGVWYRVYKGDLGTLQTGAQYTYAKRQIFKGVGGAPNVDENIVMISMRYSPFQ